MQIILIVPTAQLIILVAAVVATILLAFVVMRTNYRSATNLLYFFLSLSMIAWLGGGEIFLSQQDPLKILIWARISIFFAAPMSMFLFLLAHTLPAERLRLNKRTLIIVMVLTFIMMAFNISPLAFTGVKLINQSVSLEAGPGIIPFSTISTVFSILAVYLLIKRGRQAEGEAKQQLRLVLTGIAIMLTLIIATVLIPIIIFNSVSFVPLTPLYTLVFLAMTAYAIVKYKLFNVKVIATEALTIILWVAIFSRLFGANSLSDWVIDSFFLVFVSIFGVLLVRSVRKEVQQRERLEVLTKELQSANDKLKELDRLKTEFLSFASHQVKAPLAVMKGFATLVLEGSYGQISEKIHEVVLKIKTSCDQMIILVNNLLDMRRLEEGKMQYDLTEVFVDDFISQIVSELKPLADQKKLELSFVASGDSTRVKLDMQKFKQVVLNLIDNSIKYTPNGWVRVELHKKHGDIFISISDSGMGMASELLPKLFQQFSRDPQSRKLIQGTGLGLYIAKQIVEAHQGKIWAESAGLGKGSTFVISLPTAK